MFQTIAAQLAGQPTFMPEALPAQAWRRDLGRRSTPFRPVAGSAPLLAGVAVDITERKRAEEALRGAWVDLERMARLARRRGELISLTRSISRSPLS